MSSPHEETEVEIPETNPQVVFYPTGLRMATMVPIGAVPTGPSDPCSSGPSHGNGCSILECPPSPRKTTWDSLTTALSSLDMVGG